MRQVIITTARLIRRCLFIDYIIIQVIMKSSHLTFNLMQIESIAECLQNAFCNTFDLRGAFNM